MSGDRRSSTAQSSGNDSKTTGAPANECDCVTRKRDRGMIKASEQSGCIFIPEDRPCLCVKCLLTCKLVAVPWGWMEPGLGNGSNAACVCVWTAAGESLILPPTWVFFFPPLLLLDESEPNRYSRGIGGGSGEFKAPCPVPGSALESPGGTERTIH